MHFVAVQNIFLSTQRNLDLKTIYFSVASKKLFVSYLLLLLFNIYYQQHFIKLVYNFCFKSSISMGGPLYIKSSSSKFWIIQKATEQYLGKDYAEES